MQSPTSAPSNDVVSLRDLIDFISHVAACYPQITKDFPQHLAELLLQHHESLEAELREKAVGALVLLRKNKVIDSPTWVNTTRKRRSPGLMRLQTAQCSLSSPNDYPQQVTALVPLPEDHLRHSLL